MEYLFWLEAGRVEFLTVNSVGALLYAADKDKECWNYATDDKDWDWFYKAANTEDFIEVEVEEVPPEIRAVMLILR